MTEQTAVLSKNLRKYGLGNTPMWHPGVCHKLAHIIGREVYRQSADANNYGPITPNDPSPHVFVTIPTTFTVGRKEFSPPAAPLGIISFARCDSFRSVQQYARGLFT